MAGFTDARTPVPTDDDLLSATKAVDRLADGGVPADRMEAGLVFAMVGTRDITGRSSVEDRRFALAFARGLARERDEGGVSMSSVDWARTFAVDASIQREGEKLLSLDMLDRQARLRWGSQAVQAEPWMQAGVSPSMFARSAEDDLKAFASGSFSDLSVLRAPEVEISILSAAQPAIASLEARLHLAAGAQPVGTGSAGLTAGVVAADLSAFGPLDPQGWTGSELAALSDRMALARRAAEVGHRDARGLFDPTPGRNPFEVGHSHELAGIAAVQGSSKGRLNLVAQAALDVLGGIDPSARDDGSDGIRLSKAVARLARAGQPPHGDERTDVRILVADVLVQKCASETLGGGASPSRPLLEEMVAGTPDARESVGFWRRGQEASMACVAAGRFDLLDDSTGLASAVRNTIWRAELGGSGSMGSRIEASVAKVRRSTPPAVSGSRGPAVAPRPEPEVRRSQGLGR